MPKEQTAPQPAKEPAIKTGQAKKGSTQSYLDIDQIREGILVLKDGSMKMVLSTSSVNFELKSEMEKDAIIYGYQNFLNSLDFPIQIIVQSRKLNLDNYLENLKERSKTVNNDLLKLQMEDYVAFIENIISRANIMQKRFYIVVPHYPGGFKKLGSFAKVFSANKGNIEVSDFDTEKKYLRQKVETAASGLGGVGVRALQLDTQELIELFYGIYNPEQATTQKLINLSQLEVEIIGREEVEEMEIG